jgi:hypothetical protein
MPGALRRGGLGLAALIDKEITFSFINDKTVTGKVISVDEANNLLYLEDYGFIVNLSNVTLMQIID